MYTFATFKIQPNYFKRFKPRFSIQVETNFGFYSLHCELQVTISVGHGRMQLVSFILFWFEL